MRRTKKELTILRNAVLGRMTERNALRTALEEEK